MSVSFEDLKKTISDAQTIFDGQLLEAVKSEAPLEEGVYVQLCILSKRAMDQADQIRVVVERGFKGGALAKKRARQAPYTMDFGPSVCVCVCVCARMWVRGCVCFLSHARTRGTRIKTEKKVELYPRKKSSTVSKESDRSSASSKSSFAPLKPTASASGKKVRIAIGGSSR